MGYQRLLRNLDKNRLLVTTKNKPDKYYYSWAPEKSIEQQHCDAKSAAVVFNSSILLHHNYGELIDSHDVVIRYNFAPTIGFEQHVGERTTARAATRNWTFIEKDETMVRIYHKGEGWFLHREAPLLQSDPKLRSRFNAVHPHFINVGHHYLSGKPSTGFFGVVLALMWVDRVSLFGYDGRWQRDDRPRHKQRLHYFDDVGNSQRAKRHMRSYTLPDQEWSAALWGVNQKNYKPVHPMTREYDFYNEAYDDGKIEIYPPLKRILLL